MKGYINETVLRQIRWDSAVLDGMTVIGHVFAEHDRYQIDLRQGKDIAKTFHLVVDKSAAKNQLDIDVELVAEGAVFTVPRSGMVSFRAAGVREGYTMSARSPGNKRGAFDSAQLTEGSVFLVTLLRAGAYSLTNERAGTHAQIVLSHPKRKRTPHRPPEPMTVRCTDKGFEPDKIELQPLQTIGFTFTEPSRLLLELVKPETTR